MWNQAVWGRRLTKSKGVRRLKTFFDYLPIEHWSILLRNLFSPDVQKMWWKHNVSFYKALFHFLHEKTFKLFMIAETRSALEILKELANLRSLFYVLIVCICILYVLELLSRILKSLIKVGYPSRFKSFLSDFLHVDSPCSCDHFEMRLTYVGLLVPKL